jgi:hypothetical protein
MLGFRGYQGNVGFKASALNSPDHWPVCDAAALLVVAKTVLNQPPKAKASHVCDYRNKW